MTLMSSAGALFLALAATASLATAAPPSRDRRFAFSDTTPDLSPSAERAVLCLVREQIVRRHPMPPERLYLDGVPLAYLPQRAVVATRVEPGVHRLEGVLGCPPLVISCAPGELVLLRLREVIDEQDAVRARWLLDDPELAEGLIAQGELLPVTLTERGREDLAKRWRTVDVSARPDSALAPADTGQAVTLDQVWFEHPLDPVNLRRDFTTYDGRLEIGSRAFSYAMDRSAKGVRFQIRFEDVVGLRFGGTRSSSAQPWLDLYYRSEGQTLRGSFADSGENPEGGYNRMFAALRSRWIRVRPDSAAAGEAR